MHDVRRIAALSEPRDPQPRDHALLLATGRGRRRSKRRRRELVHVRDVGVATGRPDDPRRGSPRAPRAQALGQGRWLLHPLATLWRRLLRRGLFQPETRLGVTAELHTPFDAFERAGEAVARGNLKVFEEIGLEFARYLEECPPDAEPDAFRRFVDPLRPGDPPDGQRYLRRAFERYERLRDEADRKTRAELAVQANLEIGFHEQTRLQPQIREALDAAYSTQEEPGSSARGGVPVRVALVAGRAGPGRRPGGRGGRWCSTDGEPSGARGDHRVVLWSSPYPGPRAGARNAPRGRLSGRARRAARSELTELLARFEPASAGHDDCGARDWSDLDQRMHYIVHLFCAFHERPELSQPPFTAAQVASIARGVVPDGEL